jgi:hypothetical protein
MDVTLPLGVPVSTQVNKPENNDAELIRPIAA